MQRSKVYQMIDGERAYQQAQGKPDERKEHDWLKSIDYYREKAWRDAHKNFPEHIRKIAALAVAALEQYGCEPREGYAPQPDSAKIPFLFDWDAIPPDYEWATVEVYNDMYDQCWQVHAHLYEPQWSKEHQGWVSEGDYEHVYLVHDLPLGLDHRALKQQRPAAAPDGEE